MGEPLALKGPRALAVLPQHFQSRFSLREGSPFQAAPGGRILLDDRHRAGAETGEKLWQERERSIDDQSGFVSLDILKPGMILSMSADPPKKQDNTYHVLTRWESREAFMSWVRSDAFRKAHGQKRDRGIFGGPAQVTTHDVIEGASAP